MSVKKFLFLLFWILLFSGRPWAQKGIVIQGGSFISEKGGGFNAMAGLDFGLNKYCHLRPQIGISEKKYLRFDAFPSSSSETFSLYSNYFEFHLPFVAKLDFRSLHFFAIIGASAGYAIRLEGSQSLLEDGHWVKEHFQLGRFNSEFFYGGGLELPIARDNFLTLSITLHLGLTDINLSTEADFYHQGLSIMLGLNMPFGKK